MRRRPRPVGPPLAAGNSPRVPAVGLHSPWSDPGASSARTRARRWPLGPAAVKSPKPRAIRSAIKMHPNAQLALVPARCTSTRRSAHQLSASGAQGGAGDAIGPGWLIGSGRGHPLSPPGARILPCSAPPPADFLFWVIVWYFPAKKTVHSDGHRRARSQSSVPCRAPNRSPLRMRLTTGVEAACAKRRACGRAARHRAGR